MTPRQKAKAIELLRNLKSNRAVEVKRLAQAARETIDRIIDIENEMVAEATKAIGRSRFLSNFFDFPLQFQPRCYEDGPNQCTALFKAQEALDDTIEDAERFITTMDDGDDDDEGDA